MKSITNKYVLSIDFDDTLMLEDNEGNYYLNPKVIPLLLWCNLVGIPIVITTKRNPTESGLLALDPKREQKTLAHCLQELEKLGIKIHSIITRYDPIKPNFYLEYLKAIEEEAIGIGKKLEAKIPEGPERDAEFLTDPEYKEFKNRCKNQSEDWELQYEKNSQQKYAEANKHKEKQLQLLIKLFPEQQLLHMDDDKNIISGLKNFREQLSRDLSHQLNETFPTDCKQPSGTSKIITNLVKLKELQENRLQELLNDPRIPNLFLRKVLPINFKKDDTLWQVQLANYFGLQEHVDNFIENYDPNKSNDAKLLLVILIYLHQQYEGTSEKEKYFYLDKILGHTTHNFLSHIDSLPKPLQDFFLSQVNHNLNDKKYMDFKKPFYLSFKNGFYKSEPISEVSAVPFLAFNEVEKFTETEIQQALKINESVLLSDAWRSFESPIERRSYNQGYGFENLDDENFQTKALQDIQKTKTSSLVRDFFHALGPHQGNDPKDDKGTNRGGFANSFENLLNYIFFLNCNIQLSSPWHTTRYKALKDGSILTERYSERSAKEIRFLDPNDYKEAPQNFARPHKNKTSSDEEPILIGHAQYLIRENPDRTISRVMHGEVYLTDYISPELKAQLYSLYTKEDLPSEVRTPLELGIAAQVKFLWQQQATREEFSYRYQQLPEHYRAVFLTTLQILQIETDNKEILSLFRHLAHLPDEHGYRQSERLADEAFMEDIRAISLPAKIIAPADNNNMDKLTVIMSLPDLNNKIITYQLRDEVTDVIIDRKTGKIKKLNEVKSRHIINKINYQDHRLHFKDPSEPGKNKAVSRLRDRLYGHGSTPNVTAKFAVFNSIGNEITSYYVLITHTVNGPTLHQKLKKIEKLSPEVELIDKETHAELVLFNIQARSGDSAFRNYATTDETDENLPIKDLKSFDDEQYFVEPMVKSRFGDKLQFQEGLLTLSQTKIFSIPKIVMENFVGLNIITLVHEWLRYCDAYEGVIISMAKPGELEQFYKQDPQNPVTPYILLPEGFVTRLVLDLLATQGLFRILLEKHQEMTLPEYLKKTIPSVIRYYQTALDEDLPPLERFAKLTKQVQISVTSSQSLHASLGTVPTEEEIRNRKKYSPAAALEELKILNPAQWSDSLVLYQADMGLFNLKTEFKNLKDEQDQPDIRRQTFLLRVVLSEYSYASLDLSNCAALNDELLINILKNSSKLKHLDVSFCPNISSASIRYLARYCPDLEALYLSYSGIEKLADQIVPPQLPNMAKWVVQLTSAETVSIHFPRLKILHASHCPKLQFVNMYALNLQELKANDCQELTSVTNQPIMKKLEKLNLSHCKKLKILKFNTPDLSELNLTECDSLELKEIAFFQKHPFFLGFDFSTCSPRLMTAIDQGLCKAIKDVVITTNQKVAFRKVLQQVFAIEDKVVIPNLLKRLGQGGWGFSAHFENLEELGRTNLQIIENLQKLLLAKNEDTFANEAAKVLRTLGCADATDVQGLLEIITKTSYKYTQIRAIQALGELGQVNSKIIQVMLQGLKDKNDIVRKVTFESLKQLRTQFNLLDSQDVKDLLPDLISAIKEEYQAEGKCQKESALILISLHQIDKKIIQTLLSKPHLADLEVLWELTECINLMTDSQLDIVIRSLLEKMQDPRYRQETVVNALIKLAKTNKAVVVKILLENLKNPKESLRPFAATILGLLAQKEAPEITDYLMQIFQDDKTIRYALAQWLKKLNPSFDIVTPLREVLKEKLAVSIQHVILTADLLIFLEDKEYFETINKILCLALLLALKNVDNDSLLLAAQVLKGLGRLSIDVVTPLLQTLKGDNHDKQRLFAAKALRELGYLPSEVIQLMFRIVKYNLIKLEDIHIKHKKFVRELEGESFSASSELIRVLIEILGESDSTSYEISEFLLEFALSEGTFSYYRATVMEAVAKLGRFSIPQITHSLVKHLDKSSGPILTILSSMFSAKNTTFEMLFKNIVATTKLSLLSFKKQSVFNEFEKIIKEDNDKEFEKLIASAPNFLEVTTDDGKTLLHLAAKNGAEKITRILLSSFGDIEVYDQNRCTPLYTAFKCNKLNIFLLLLQHLQKTQFQTIKDAIHWNPRALITTALSSRDSKLVILSMEIAFGFVSFLGDDDYHHYNHDLMGHSLLSKLLDLAGEVCPDVACLFGFIRRLRTYPGIIYESANCPSLPFVDGLYKVKGTQSSTLLDLAQRSHDQKIIEFLTNSGVYEKNSLYEAIRNIVSFYTIYQSGIENKKIENSSIPSFSQTSSSRFFQLEDSEEKYDRTHKSLKEEESKDDEESLELKRKQSSPNE